MKPPAVDPEALTRRATDGLKEPAPEPEGKPFPRDQGLIWPKPDDDVLDGWDEDDLRSP